MFIQNNINEEITLDDIAIEAGFSSYHFHRLFKEFSGESLKAYIRRLRLENAAFRLKTQQEQIIDIAFDSGFYTHETFSRAFNKKFGLNPSDYKKNDFIQYKDKFISTVKKIYFKKRNCIFKRYTGPYEHSGTPEDNNSNWHYLSATLPKQYHDLTKLELFGISYDDPLITNTNNIRYDACIGIPPDLSYNETALSLPEGYYITATHTGTFEQLTESYHYLIYNWLAMYNYQMPIKIPPFEQFHLKKIHDQPVIDFITIYIPIKNI